MEIISTPLFFRSLENLYSFDSWEKNEGMSYFEPFFVKIWWNVQCGLPFLALYSVFRVNGRYWAFLSHTQVPVTHPPHTCVLLYNPQPPTPLPPPPKKKTKKENALVPVKFPEMQMSPKH